MTRRPPRFIDSTLREGAQVPGLHFAAEDRRAIAAALEAAGIEALDLGLPGEDAGAWRELADLAAVLRRSEAGVSVRALDGELDLAADHGFEAVYAVFPASELHLERKFGWTVEALQTRLGRFLDAAGTRGLRVHVVAEDASRGSPALLSGLAGSAAAGGAATLILCDTVGVMRPTRVAAWLDAARTAAPALPLGVHVHDDFGMATANTVAAAEAGADWLATTMNGLGERAGNAVTLEVAAALRLLVDVEADWDLAALAAAADLVAEAAAVPLSLQAPLVGWAAFRHESGIHVDGLLRDSRVYEPIDPALVGRSREFVLGASSGRAHVRHLLRTLGFGDGNEALVDELTRRVRAESAAQAAARRRRRSPAEPRGVDVETFRRLVAECGGGDGDAK